MARAHRWRFQIRHYLIATAVSAIILAVVAERAWRKNPNRPISSGSGWTAYVGQYTTEDGQVIRGNVIFVTDGFLFVD